MTSNQKLWSPVWTKLTINLLNKWIFACFWYFPFWTYHNNEISAYWDVYKQPNHRKPLEKLVLYFSEYAIMMEYFSVLQITTQIIHRKVAIEKTWWPNWHSQTGILECFIPVSGIFEYWKSQHRSFTGRLRQIRPGGLTGLLRLFRSLFIDCWYIARLPSVMSNVFLLCNVKCISDRIS